MTAKKSKIYSVTLSPAGNVYDESQLLKSIFESIFAVTHTKVQESAYVLPPKEPENPMKGDSS